MNWGPGRVDTTYAIFGADGPAIVVPMDGERCRLVVALSNGDEHSGWGAGVGKRWSNDLPDIKRATSILLLLRRIDGLVLAYVDSILSSVVARDGGTDNLRGTVCSRGLHEPGAAVHSGK